MRGRDENGQPVGCFAEFFATSSSSIRHQKTVRMRKCSARVHGTSLRISQQEKNFRTNLFLIATHGAALQSMMLWVNKQPICDFWKSGLKKNCSVTKVEVKDGQIKVLEEGEKQYNV